VTDHKSPDWRLLLPWRVRSGHDEVVGVRLSPIWGKCYWYINFDKCLLVPIPFNFLVKWIVSSHRRLRQGSVAIWESAYQEGRVHGAEQAKLSFDIGYQKGREDMETELIVGAIARGRRIHG
jgi:hypothetical protein